MAGDHIGVIVGMCHGGGRHGGTEDDGECGGGQDDLGKEFHGVTTKEHSDYSTLYLFCQYLRAKKIPAAIATGFKLDSRINCRECGHAYSDRHIQNYSAKLVQDASIADYYSNLDFAGARDSSVYPILDVDDPHNE
jgi:hypothetical protein